MSPEKVQDWRFVHPFMSQTTPFVQDDLVFLSNSTTNIFDMSRVSPFLATPYAATCLLQEDNSALLVQDH